LASPSTIFAGVEDLSPRPLLSATSYKKGRSRNGSSPPSIFIYLLSSFIDVLLFILIGIVAIIPRVFKGFDFDPDIRMVCGSGQLLGEVYE
jgi:hypothetical protein